MNVKNSNQMCECGHECATHRAVSDLVPDLLGQCCFNGCSCEQFIPAAQTGVITNCPRCGQSAAEHGYQCKGDESPLPINDETKLLREEVERLKAFENESMVGPLVESLIKERDELKAKLSKCVDIFKIIILRVEANQDSTLWIKDECLKGSND